jgi:MFS family permease
MSKCFYGWYMVILSGILRLSTCVAHTTGMTMVIDHFEKDLNISRTTISTIWTIALFFSSALVPFAGSLLDKYGARRMI